MSQVTTFKVVFKNHIKDDKDKVIDNRRISLPGNHPEFDKFLTLVSNYIIKFGFDNYSIKYIDCDGDYCTVTNQEEWESMINHAYDNNDDFLRPTICVYVVKNEKVLVKDPQVDKNIAEPNNTAITPFISNGYMSKVKLPKTLAIYRYYSDELNDTRLEYEFGGLARLCEYKYETPMGYIFTSEEPGTIPLHHYYCRKIKNNLYTIDPTEIGTTRSGDYGKNDYRYEGVFGFVYPPETNLATIEEKSLVPLLRYWSEERNDHFYSIIPEEIGTVEPLQMGKNSYICEGPNSWNRASNNWAKTN